MSIQPKTSQTAKHFDEKYTRAKDPWCYATSEYESSKYQHALATLPRPSYENALEIGCSVGIMTQRLATRCDRLVAVDCSGVALSSARQRCVLQPNIRFVQAQLPNEFPRGQFDLITLCETGYYLSETDLLSLCEKIKAGLTTGGHLLLVHWLGDVEDGPLSARTVHQLIRESGDLKPVAYSAQPEYLLELLERL